MLSIFYGSLVAFLVVLDQVTKWLALRWCAHVCTLNRGISWGMLNYEGPVVFSLLTLLVMLITFALGLYAYRRAHQGHYIFGELLIISGSLSNCIDRFVYGGVVDFIEVRVGSWVGPSFNLADSMVVVGVGLMAFELLCCRKTCDG